MSSHEDSKSDESDSDEELYQSAADFSPIQSSNEELPSINSSTNSAYYTAQNEKWRNLMAYFLLGLTNNFAYVVMLSAAHDILSKDFTHDDDDSPFNKTSNSSSNPRDCNTKGTGMILLVDIIPSLVIKVLAPFMCFNVHLRLVVVVTLCSLSFLFVGLASSFPMAILGVVCASASSGLGEPTLLAYSTFFHRVPSGPLLQDCTVRFSYLDKKKEESRLLIQKSHFATRRGAPRDVISTFSSGTGAAGLLGSLSYAALTTVGLSPRQTLLIMLVVPFIMSLSFWNLLEHPTRGPCWKTLLKFESGSSYNLLTEAPELAYRHSSDSEIFYKLRSIPSLFKYMGPLVLVYMAEYLTNQGLSELIYFPLDENWISHSEQYRWYQVLYQVGVLISRSSVNLIQIERIWIMAVLQWLNVIVFLTAAIYWWIGSIWVVFLLILWEGLLGGAAYVNTFYKVSSEVPPERREFAMQVISMSDTSGIAISGFLAVPLHNFICRLPL